MLFLHRIQQSEIVPDVLVFFSLRVIDRLAGSRLTRTNLHARGTFIQKAVVPRPIDGTRSFLNVDNSVWRRPP